jgi:hypothetical protein
MYHRWLWSPPQVNYFVYSDDHKFKFRLGAIRQNQTQTPWKLISRT